MFLLLLFVLPMQIIDLAFGKSKLGSSSKKYVDHFKSHWVWYDVDTVMIYHGSRLYMLSLWLENLERLRFCVDNFSETLENTFPLLLASQYQKNTWSKNNQKRWLFHDRKSHQNKGIIHPQTLSTCSFFYGKWQVGTMKDCWESDIVCWWWWESV